MDAGMVKLLILSLNDSTWEAPHWHLGKERIDEDSDLGFAISEVCDFAQAAELLRHQMSMIIFTDY